jgi:serine-type D-Ala-D-Ala carboxypeptidase (penicillin-binding protein 5/6)
MKFVFPFIVFLLLPCLADAAVMPPAPVLPARAYVLYDYTSNQMLVASNTAHEHIAPGSLAKLMTAYLAFGAVEQNQFPLIRKIYPSLGAVGMQGNEPRMFLDHSKPVSVDDLLHGLAIQSGNDAARALAELISGSEAAFSAQMNSHAHALGMLDTHFVNATGLPDPQQYSSAYDMALLAIAIVRDFPRYYQMYGMREYAYNDVKLFNTNRLLWSDPHIDGLANGHDEDSGYNQVASAQRGDRRLISVVLGAPSESRRDRASQDLLNYGFRYFEIVPLYRHNQAAATLRIWKGTDSTVDVGFPNGLSVTVPRGTMPKFKAAMVTQQPIVAPVTAGQKLGVLKLTLDGKPYAEFPLVALQDVPLANVFSRGWDNIRLLFK